MDEENKIKNDEAEKVNDETENVEAVEVNATESEESSEKSSSNSKNMDKTTKKVMCVIGYFWILFLVPLLAAPQDDEFVKFHTNQAILYCITSAILSVISGILNLIPIVGIIITSIVSLLLLIVLILQIVAVCQDKMREIPLIGKIRILK